MYHLSDKLVLEIAYSLNFNRQLIYYDGGSGDDEMVSQLLKLDEAKVRLPSGQLLKQADCWKRSDRMYIEVVLDKHFESHEDDVDTIKAFVESCISVSGLTLIITQGEVGEGTKAKARFGRFWKSWRRSNKQQQQQTPGLSTTNIERVPYDAKKIMQDKLEDDMKENPLKSKHVVGCACKDVDSNIIHGQTAVGISSYKYYNFFQTSGIVLLYILIYPPRPPPHIIPNWRCLS